MTGPELNQEQFIILSRVLKSLETNQLGLPRKPFAGSTTDGEHSGKSQRLLSRRVSFFGHSTDSIHLFIPSFHSSLRASACEEPH